MRTLRIFRLIAVALAVALLGAVASCAWNLISDKEMIDHFNAHKAEFEKLVESYLHFDHRKGDWDKLPEVIELKRLTGVQRIIDHAGYWFENPYSIEAAKQLKEMDENKSWGEHRDRKTASVQMQDQRRHYDFDLRSAINWKDYVYYPAAPEIENGRIKLPRELIDRKYGKGDRVLESLDSPRWEYGECVLRRIDPQWFLRRCRSR
jgi:hypothetical protein